MVCPITCYLHYEHACSWFKTITVVIYTLYSTRDGFSYFRSGGGGGGVDKYLGGAATCFGRGMVATQIKAKKKV